MPSFLDQFPTLLVLNLAMAGFLTSLLGLGAASILRRRSASLRHAVLLATVVLTLLSPAFVGLLGSMNLGWIVTGETVPEPEPPPKKPAASERPRIELVAEADGPSSEPESAIHQGETPISPEAKESGPRSTISTKPRSSEPRVARVEPLPTLVDVPSADPELRSIVPPVPIEIPSRRSAVVQAAVAKDSSEEKPSTERRTSREESWNRLSVTAIGFAGVWLVGILLGCFRFLRRCLIVSRIRRSRTPVTDSRILQVARDAAACLGIREGVRIDSSPMVPVPVSLGWPNRGIILPNRLWEQLDGRELGDVLLHESAHLVRGDHRAGLIQELARVLFWWNLPLFVVNRRLSALREQICDGYVLAHGSSGADYAETLVRVAEWSAGLPRNPLPATSLFSNVDELAHRLAHLVEGTQTMPLTLKKKTLAAISVLSLLVGTACCLPLVRAAQPEEGNDQLAAIQPADDPQEREKSDAEKEQERLEREAKAEQRLQEIMRLKMQQQALQAEQQKLQKEIDERRSRLLAIQKILLSRMADRGGPGERLFGSLAILDATRDSAEPGLYDYRRGIEGLKLFLTVNLKHGTRDVTPNQLATMVEDLKGEHIDQFRQVEAEYRLLSQKRSPYDWMIEKEKWFQIAADFLSPGDGDELAKRGAKQIENDPNGADLYGLLYLEQIRFRKPKTVDFPLLARFHSGNDLEAAQRLTRMVLVLAAWDFERLPRENADRQSLWNELLKLLEEEELGGRFHQDFRLLSGVFRDFWAGLSPDDRTAFLNAFLDHQKNPFWIRWLADLAGVDQATVRQWFLSKPEGEIMEFVKTPFNDALDFMEDVTPATVWRDPVVAGWEKEITKTVGGTWLDAMDQLLAGTPFEAALLDDGIVWIGPPAKRKAIEQRLREAKALAEHFPELKDSTHIEFIDTPLRDGLNFIADANDIYIFLMAGEAEGTQITLTIDWLPLYITLERIAELSGTRWGVLGESLVVGSEKTFPLWERAIADYRRHQITLTGLNLAKDPFGEKLQADTDIEFIDTPLIDALEFLSDLHKIPFAAIGVDIDLALNMNSGNPLAETLTILLAKHELAWDTDGHAVLIGDRNTVQHFRSLSAKRHQRKKKAPAAVQNALDKKVSIDFNLQTAKTPDDKTEILKTAIESLSQPAGIKITPHPDLYKVWAKETPWLTVTNVPLETVLNLLATADDHDWWITDEGNIEM